MKSLEILRQGVEFMEAQLQSNPLTSKEIELEIGRYKEAIAELKEKDEEIFNLNELIDELKEAQTSWIAERADLQTIIEKQGERIRYLEQQFRDLNPKEINQ